MRYEVIFASYAEKFRASLPLGRSRRWLSGTQSKRTWQTSSRLGSSQPTGSATAVTGYCLDPDVISAVLKPASPRRPMTTRGIPATWGCGSSAPANLDNVMAVAITGDYEAYLSIGVGMRKQIWVRVSTLDEPTRVVIGVGR